jgi:hypothetical protein
VQPYVSWVGVPMGGCPLQCTSDVSTLTHPSPATPDKDTVDVAWRIGGAITVDQTQVGQNHQMSLEKRQEKQE